MMDRPVAAAGQRLEREATVIDQDIECDLIGHVVRSLQRLAEQVAVAKEAGLTVATATDPRSLPKQQANIAYWLSRKYRVAPEPISALVAEAYDIGQQKRIDPTLILAVMAIESGFNPFAQSTMGAQGLMQVRTEVHTDKYDNFGGDFAAFDPVANLRVGVEVLREAIQRNGGIEAGLRQYVGAALSGEDGGYVNKVLAEQQRIKDVAHGKQVSTQAVKPNEEDGLVELWDKAKSLTAPFKENPSKP